jgi:hypothetical protein
MKTRVEKLGPGSWVVFVNGQRHDETFVTRSAARREAKRQKETNLISGVAASGNSLSIRKVDAVVAHQARPFRLRQSCEDRVNASAQWISAAASPANPYRPRT